MARPPLGKSKLLWVAVTVVLAAAVVGGVYAALSFGPAQKLPGGSVSGPGSSSQPTVTTLAAIVDGNFTSAVDKLGDGGSYVEVRNVTVFKVITEEADGDWHVYMQDPTYDQFIGEIIPRDQPTEGEPPLNVSLTVWGITYCDVEHQYDAWHGYTCWEIHPLTSWAETRTRVVPSVISHSALGYEPWFWGRPPPRDDRDLRNARSMVVEVMVAASLRSSSADGTAPGMCSL